ncbi:GNAT family N-acetyltransferase [Aliiroseovarius sp. YM-037]|uniref:GNAT family N-acetyltransferase n=1 Tax=Aliiroseovarius sp. YM-037 TaxID=3341728 RepID=UPI003A80B390
MKIRRATEDDIPTILAIWNPEIRNSATTFNSVEKSEADVRAMLIEKADAGFAFLVAEVSGAVVGFAYYSQFRGGAGYARCMEHSVYLAPEAKGRGIGRALMTEIEDHARSIGAHTIFAGVSADNPAGVAFHESVGYIVVARLSEVGWKFGRWLDLVLLQKHL